MNTSLKTLLIFSVTFNALLVGILLGEGFHNFSRCQHHTTGAQEQAEAAAAMLPDDKRKLLEDILAPTIQEIHAQISASKKEALQIIKAPSFDEKAYRAKADSNFKIRTKAKNELTDAVIKVAKQFSPEERAILAEYLASALVSAPVKP